MRIIFFGTPHFAVPSLEILLENKKNVVAVVTAPDKPAGRGRKLTASPIKECALKYNVPVLQPVNMKSPEFIETLRTFEADLQIVVAFRMMPEMVWNMPSKGTFNLHGSLLPQYRGAAPINWAIINGEKETGVTTFFLQHEIDTGNIIFSRKLEIDANENASVLHDKMMLTGADLVLKTVIAIESGSVSVLPQQLPASGLLKSAPKLNPENTCIDWTISGEEIRNKIRGLSLHPGAHTTFENSNADTIAVKIFQSSFIELDHNHSFGEIESDNKSNLKVFVSKGYISIEEIQLPGKSRMKIRDLLNGYKFEGRWIAK